MREVTGSNPIPPTKKIGTSGFEVFIYLRGQHRSRFIFMKFITDFHIHSKYSRATSKDMDLESLAKWAKIKGIKVLGTGDFTHPEWLKNLKEKLEPVEPGLFKIRKEDSDIRFLLTSEISCIYSKKNRVRKIHIILFSPSFEAVEKINAQLGWIGNLKSDGRPILGLDAKELAKIALDASPQNLVVPAHAWTPWFSIFGSKSGFDSIEECFEDYAKYIYAIETGLSCYDIETEVLTENGWKKFTEVAYKDKICTLNLQTNKIEFQNPMKIHTYNYKGKMYKLKTKRVDLFVTPNHKLLFSPCDFRKPPKFSLREAELLFNKSKQFKKDGIWIGKNIQYFTLPTVKMKWGCQYYSGGLRIKPAKKIPIKSWLKFFGFWIAEGWTTKGKDGDYNICLANRNNTLLFEMKNILESFGYSIYWGKKTDNVIRVRDYQLFHYLKQFGKCSDKFVPSEIKSLSRELLEIFLEYYIKGDGHIYGRSGKGLSATTTSVRLRDDLQEIALKAGMSVYYKLHRKKGTLFRSPGYKYKKIYKQRNDSWVTYFIRKNLHTVLPSTIKKYNYTEVWVDFEGPVYCVTVPNHVIYVRRNGIPVWCGNSDPAMNWRLSALDKITLISNSDAHSPHKIGREANVFDTELSYSAIIDAIKEKNLHPVRNQISNGVRKFLYTIEFFPEEGKYHFDGHRLCGITLSPQESKKYNNICPRCGKPLTIGVLNRVEELADRAEGQKPQNAIPYKSLIPLGEIIADVLGTLPGSKRVEEEYQKLIKNFKTEFEVLLNATRKDLETVTLPEIAEAIARVREGKVFIEPGYDGVYGKIKIFSQEKPKEPVKQGFLF